MDTFATAITCIDGRVQQPVSDWVRLQFSVDHVDLITEPGPDKVLAQGAAELIAGIVRRASFSIEHHHSQIVVLAGHDHCAANPVSKEEHFEQITEGVRVLISYELPVRMIGIWVNELGAVELVCDTSEPGPLSTAQGS